MSDDLRAAAVTTSTSHNLLGRSIDRPKVGDTGAEGRVELRGWVGTCQVR